MQRPDKQKLKYIREKEEQLDASSHVSSRHCFANNTFKDFQTFNSHTPGGAIQGVGDGKLKTVDNKEIATATAFPLL
jgi:hypothetical protein